MSGSHEEPGFDPSEGPNALLGTGGQQLRPPSHWHIAHGKKNIKNDVDCTAYFGYSPYHDPQLAHDVHVRHLWYTDALGLLYLVGPATTPVIVTMVLDIPMTDGYLNSLPANGLKVFSSSPGSIPSSFVGGCPNSINSLVASVTLNSFFYVCLNLVIVRDERGRHGERYPP